MTCPLLQRSRLPRCRAVMGGDQPVTHQVVAAYCRGAYGGCPAYRYLRAAGHLVHPQDFTAWVVRGITPGRLETDPDAPHASDAP